MIYDNIIDAKTLLNKAFKEYNCGHADKDMCSCESNPFALEEAVSRIFNDINSRVCENCSFGKHVQTLGIDMKMYKCAKEVSEFGNRLTPSNNNATFGCSLFKRSLN